MNTVLGSLATTTVLASASDALRGSVESMRTEAGAFKDLRRVLSVTSEYGASRPVLDATGVLEHFGSALTDMPSLESMDVIPARQSDARTKGAVAALTEVAGTESAVLGNWMLETSPKMFAYFDMASTAVTDLAAAAESMADKLECSIADDSSLAMVNIVGYPASENLQALQSLSAVLPSIGALDASKLNDAEYLKGNLEGFTGLMDTPAAAGCGFALKDGVVSVEELSSDASPRSATLLELGYNVPETVSALRAAAEACRAVEALLDDRTAMAECLAYGVDSLPSTEAVVDDVQTLSQTRALVGNYVTTIPTMVSNVLTRSAAALSVGEAISPVI